MAVKYLQFGFNQEESKIDLSLEENRESFINAYQEAFKNSVYNENFSKEEVNGILDWYQENADYEGILIVDDSEIVGFSFGFRLEPEFDNEKWRRKKGFENVPESYFDGETFYYAELGLEEEYREEGIGKESASAVFDEVESMESMSRLLVRTNEDNPVRSLYEENDFRLLEDLTTEIEQRRDNGEIETDTRIWLTKEL
jgi:GNAT superfamily N-acetyltransferase